MPALEPPAACPGHPVTSTLPAGTVLYRVHRADRSASAFNPTPRPAPPPGDPVPGGRFDSIDGSYAYLYAALSEDGAFCESFVRDLDYTRAGPRPLPWARVGGKVVSTVRTRRDVELVEVQGAAAEQLGQDDWLTRCDEDAYPLARRWAAAVRAWLPPPVATAWAGSPSATPSSGSWCCGVNRPMPPPAAGCWRRGTPAPPGRPSTAALGWSGSRPSWPRGASTSSGDAAVTSADPS